MCEVDFDGDYPKFSETYQRRARKAHRCRGCRGTIRPGEQYTVHDYENEGSVETEKECAACTAAIDEFAAAHGDQRVYPSGLHDVLVECTDDGEPGSAERWQPLIDAMDARRAAARGAESAHSLAAAYRQEGVL